MLQRAALAHQEQPPACPLALGALLKLGQPDRRRELAPGELGQHPGVDLVGLARQRREALDPLRVGDLDLPPQALELIVHKASAVHRLDRRADRLAIDVYAIHQAAQPVGIRRHNTTPRSSREPSSQSKS
jgi:hypothetical protein